MTTPANAMSPPSPINIWLVRHAQPVVEPGVCYGAMDVAADDVATKLAARALADVLPQGCQVRVSTLQRCEQLAQAVCGLRPDLMPKPEPRLVEMNFGAWEGQRWADINRTELDAWTADFAHWRCGGSGGTGGGGECVQDFMQRVATVWDECLENARLTAPSTPVVWITHAGVIRAANLLAAGQRQVLNARYWPEAAPAFGAWQRLESVG